MTTTLLICGVLLACLIAGIFWFVWTIYRDEDYPGKTSFQEDEDPTSDDIYES